MIKKIAFLIFISIFYTNIHAGKVVSSFVSPLSTSLGGTGVTTTGAFVTNNYSQSVTINSKLNVTGTVSANYFSGNGGGLTGLNASSLTSGTISPDRLPATVVTSSRTINGHALSANVVVTKADILLGSADNTSDANKPVSTLQQTALDLKATTATLSNYVPILRTVNGHTLTTNITISKSDVGLGNADNTSDLNKPVSLATQTKLDLKATVATLNNYILKTATENYDTAYAERNKWDGGSTGLTAATGRSSLGLGSIATRNQADFVTTSNQASTIAGYVPISRTVNGYALSSNVSLIKSDISLGNVDNTSDADKPVSSLQQTALDLKATTATLSNYTLTIDLNNAVSLLATKNASLVQFTNEPGYLTAATLGVVTANLATKDYVNTSLNAYAKTATLNNYVKTTRTVAGHALSADVTVSKSDVGLGNADNTSDANKPISTAQQAALNAKVTANAGITGETKTKITYSTLGLVTAGTDATTADIADSTDRRYVTDAQRTVIQNASGTNTGDQTITLTSDVTGSGAGSFATTIANDAVSNAKLANMANSTIKGRTTSGTGDPEDLSVSDTKTLLSLNNVDDTSDLNKPLSTATISTLNNYVKTTRSVNGHALSADVTVTKADVFLGSVDNTSDANKPISGAQQAALNLKFNIASANSYILKTATANYDMAVADRLKWDGGATGLTASTGRTSLGLGSMAVQNTTDYVTTSNQEGNLANYVPVTRSVNGRVLSDDISVTAGDVGLDSVENTALSTWAGSTNLTTVGTLGQNLLVNGSSYIYGSPTARSLKQSTGTNATLNISALIQNTTELTATGTATYGARGLSVGINGNNFGTGTIALIGVVGEPIVTSSSATSKIGLTGLQGRAFRGNVNDKSSDSSNSLTGVLGFSGHQALLPQTALTNAAKSGVFTMTSLSGTITTAEAGEFNVNVGNTAGTTANVTTGYGIKTAATIGASSGSATSTLSTYYAAFLGSPVVNLKGVLTTNFGLYQESATAKNYFAGAVGIGTTAPAYALDIVGTANATLGVRSTKLDISGTATIATLNVTGTATLTNLNATTALTLNGLGVATKNANLSQFTNNSGYIKTDDAARLTSLQIGSTGGTFSNTGTTVNVSTTFNALAGIQSKNLKLYGAGTTSSGARLSFGIGTNGTSFIEEDASAAKTLHIQTASKLLIDNLSVASSPEIKIQARATSLLKLYSSTNVDIQATTNILLTSGGSSTFKTGQSSVSVLELASSGNVQFKWGNTTRGVKLILPQLSSAVTRATSVFKLFDKNSVQIATVNYGQLTDLSTVVTQNAFVTHLHGITATPSISAGTGAGTGPTVAMGTGSTDIAGIANVTTGTVPSGTNASVVTITFATPYTKPTFVQLTPNNAATALLSGVTMIYTTDSTSTFIIKSGTTALTGSTAYSWKYHVLGGK